MPRKVTIVKTQLVPQRNKLDHERMEHYTPGIDGLKADMRLTSRRSNPTIPRRTRKNLVSRRR